MGEPDMHKVLRKKWDSWGEEWYLAINRGGRETGYSDELQNP